MKENTSLSGQMPLPVRLDDSATLDNFFLSAASENRSVIEGLQLKTGERNAYLWGDAGAGVTHLIQGLCHQEASVGKNAIYLPLSELSEQDPQQLLPGLESLDFVALDEIESVLGNADWEEQLFHLFNKIHAGTGRMIFGAHCPPTHLQLGLADLGSRFGSLLIFRVQKLTDEELVKALIFRAKRRGMDLSGQVAEFLATRFSRSLKDQFNYLDQLDRASLAEQRKLTIPFVKSVLEAQKND